MKNTKLNLSLLCGSGIVLLLACGEHKKKYTAPKEKQIVANVRELDEVVKESITERLSLISDNDGILEDSLPAFRPQALQDFYKEHENKAEWSDHGKMHPAADSMMEWIARADEYGLLPKQYHANTLTKVWSQLRDDAAAKKDAALWAKADILLSDAFMKMTSDLHYGPGPRDSVTFRTDSLFPDKFLKDKLRAVVADGNISAAFEGLEPTHPGYIALKEGIKSFKDKYEGQSWDTLPLNYTDTIGFRQLLANRLVQGQYLDTAGKVVDTTMIKAAVKAFQNEFNIYADGVAGKRTVMALNRTPADWLMQAGINMDRWRKLPDTMPREYIMVNVPGYTMRVIDSGEVMLESRVIVGAPRTRTPLLNSYMTNVVLFPYWRVPYSIVFKEMLPAIKRNVGYLASKNLEVINKDGEAVDPNTIDWNKLSKDHFPYVLRQMDGVDNSLGIMKFNFRNKYSVYLHDTNNRGLFKNSMRAMSHGCVRVQQWDSLSQYLVRMDTTQHRGDSIKAWIARGEKKQVDLTRRLPIYLRYFTAEGRDGKLIFFDDIYGEDKVLRREMKYN
ncbi:murein L,D-transpeptidase YcbB/YkuD [Chitinophaga dinghuensis]|uniref:Murein L,D-transpeptidase YcbB/YkuD n=1 Tax=Chitinophaga dinghuensis TaxID=1539050 RepID=A0A327W394_9BACT|nr:L,D-transpeptidase family protein [Chitinophaga dinghuensis]RAJ83262.1 murein L,D-transpeptidase YcbB/YkuD [Chitinophaga dinghuensis]